MRASQGAKAQPRGPVCSVSRSSIVTGMYPTTLGTMHHRSGGIRAPAFLKFIPNLMGEAGYYTTNWKADFNIVGMKYDQSGKARAHWRSRPDKSQPFFSKFDFGECHSSITQTAEPEVVEGILPSLKEALADESIDVRLLAAGGLFNLGHYKEALPVVIAEMAHPNTDVQVRVGNILDSQPPDANEQLQAAIQPLAVAKQKFKPQGRYPREH